MKNWQDALDEVIQQRSEQLRGLRRQLHAQPELSGHERETSLYLYQLLGDEGLDVRMGPDGRGLIVDESAADEEGNGRIALRADIDALRIHDTKQVDYRSQRPGVMHACGHDAHTAIVFGAISSLGQLRREDKLPWPVSLRAIFQPAEETCEGAKEMIRVGALQGVSAIVATHMDPMRQVGHVGLRQGVLTANCDSMALNVVGRGGHAARPHEASDPIAAAAQLINAMYQFIPRATDSQDAVVVTIGQITAGENANVIPEEVELRGTVRTLDREVRRQTFEHIRRLAAGIGQTTDTSISVDFGLGSASIDNDNHLIDLMRRASRDVVGAEGLDEIPRPSMGSEDFSFYLQEVPGAMIRLGCTSPSAGGFPLHSPAFDIDERVLQIGARILARTVIMWADNQTAD